MSIRRALGGLVMLSLGVRAEAAPPTFVWEPQHGAQLCWAAAAVTAWSAVGETKRQCDFATSCLDNGNCCLNGIVNAKLERCDQPSPWAGTYDCAQPSTPHGDYLPSTLNSRHVRLAQPADRGIAPTWAFLQDELETRKRPVVVAWHFKDPCDYSGHVVTAVYVDRSTDPPELIVSDPREGTKSWSVSAFQCGSAGYGSCAVYYGIGGATTFASGEITQLASGCGGAVPLDAQVALAPLASRIALRVEATKARDLALPADGDFACEGPAIQVEYEGDEEVRHLLVDCQRGSARFLVALAPSPAGGEILWFGARVLADQIARAKKRLGDGVGTPVIRFYPRTGAARLFRRGTDEEGVWIVGGPTG